jgi:hypothetical protein
MDSSAMSPSRLFCRWVAKEPDILSPEQLPPFPNFSCCSMSRVTNNVPTTIHSQPRKALIVRRNLPSSKALPYPGMPPRTLLLLLEGNTMTVGQSLGSIVDIAAHLRSLVLLYQFFLAFLLFSFFPRHCFQLLRLGLLASHVAFRLLFFLVCQRRRSYQMNIYDGLQFLL